MDAATDFLGASLRFQLAELQLTDSNCFSAVSSGKDQTRSSSFFFLEGSPGSSGPTVANGCATITV